MDPPLPLQVMHNVYEKVSGLDTVLTCPALDHSDEAQTHPPLPTFDYHLLPVTLKPREREREREREIGGGRDSARERTKEKDREREREKAHVRE